LRYYERMKFGKLLKRAKLKQRGRFLSYGELKRATRVQSKTGTVNNLFCDYPWAFGSKPRFVRFSILVFLWMKADITDNTFFFNLSLTLQLLPRHIVEFC